MKTTFFIVILFLMMFLATGQAQVTIGSLENSVGGALLELKEREIANGDTTSSDRGLLFPRMKLTNVDELYPMYSSNDDYYDQNKARLKAEHIGLTVYNLNNKDGFNPGLHVWNGESWVKPVTELPVVNETSINLLNLSGCDGEENYSFNVRKATPPEAGQPVGSGGGSILRFGGENYITIPENGAYFFILRLAGVQGIGTGTYYISLWANGSIQNPGPNAVLSNSTIKDITTITAHVNPIINSTPSSGINYAQSIALGGYFNAGDRVYIKMSYNEDRYQLHSVANIWQLFVRSFIRVDCTNLAWWKL